VVSHDRQPVEFSVLAMEALPRLYGLARRLAGGEAEDLVQEALVKAYRGRDQLKDPEAASGWLRSILINVYRDRLRSARRRVQEVALDDLNSFSLYKRIAEDDPFPYSDSLHLDFMGLFGADDVHAVLREMPEIYRAPLVLHYMEDYATKEIARLLSVPLGTLLARLHRGRKLFERMLWEYAQREGLLQVAEKEMVT
jgi:RNA polymerase sigma-70 factor (ECF subfamily)